MEIVIIIEKKVYHELTVDTDDFSSDARTDNQKIIEIAEQINYIKERPDLILTDYKEHVKTTEENVSVIINAID